MNAALRQHVIVLALYTALTVLMTLPVLLNITTHVAGSGGDPWQTMWRFETKAELLSESRMRNKELSFVKEEFLGQGEPRLVNLSVWPWMWLHWLFGQPVAYNLVWLLTFILSGYGMYLLIKQLLLLDKNFQFPISNFQSLRDAGPFIAGVAYMFLPYHVAHSQGHFGAMQIQWLPYIVLLGVSSFRKPHLLKAVGLAVLLGIQAWSEHHYILWVALLGVMYYPFNRKRITSRMRKRSMQAHAVLFVILVMLLVVVPYVPTIRLALQPNSSLILGREQLVRFSADVFSFIVPPPWHPLWGDVSNSLFAQYFTGNAKEATQFLGFLPVLLVIFFRKSLSTRITRFWFAVAIVFFFVSLGPQLHIFGTVTGLSLPYDLIDNWPVISSVRSVARAGAMVGLALSVLFGLVLSKQIRRWQSAVAVLVIVCVEFLFVPMPIQSATLSNVYDTIGAMQGKALVEIPAATNYVAASHALYASGRHGKKVLGNIALERAMDREHFVRLKRIPVLRQLLYMRTTELRQGRPEFFSQDLAETLPDVMRWYEVSAIIVHPDSLSELQTSAVRKFLEEKAMMQPQEIDDVLMYPVKTAPDRASAKSDGVFLIREDGWEHVGFDPKRESVFAEVPHEAYMTAVNVTDVTVDVELVFDVPQESEGTFSIELDRRKVAEFGEQRGQRINVLTSIPSGEHEVRFINKGEEKLIVQNPSLVTRNP